MNKRSKPNCATNGKPIHAVRAKATPKKVLHNVMAMPRNRVEVNCAIKVGATTATIRWEMPSIKRLISIAENEGISACQNDIIAPKIRPKIKTR